MLVVVSIGVFANSVMKYNSLLEEQKALEALLEENLELKEEYQELIASGYSKEEIIRIAKEKWGLYLPDEEIIIPK